MAGKNNPQGVYVEPGSKQGHVVGKIHTLDCLHLNHHRTTGMVWSRQTMTVSMQGEYGGMHSKQAVVGSLNTLSCLCLNNYRHGVVSAGKNNQQGVEVNEQYTYMATWSQPQPCMKTVCCQKQKSNYTRACGKRG